MIDATPEPPREVSFPIDYQVFGNASRNLDFKGSGLLTIRPDRPTYVFHGKARKMFPGAAIDRELGPDHIWNVAVAGRQVTFHTNRGPAAAPKGPFVFFCRTAAEAGEVAALLPTHLDQDFVATRDFVARLNALEATRGPWDSVTNIIIALNVVVFVVMGCLGAGWFEVDSMMPYVLYGANNGAATTDGEWWRLLTSMFMHYGFVHLLLNMWALYQAGHFLEKLLGRWAFALTYLGSGLAGGFLSIAWHGDKTWSAGASGAVFGVYGAILGYLLREKQGLPPGIYQPMMKSTLTFAAYNIIYGLRAGVDNSAHVGGVLGGLVLGWLLALPVDGEVRRQKAGGKLQLGVAAVVALVVAGVLFTPRFDYRVRDEFSWEDANKDFVGKETALLQRHQKAMEEIDKGADGTAHAAWLAAELVPFYESWDRSINALQLAPGRLTARRRDALDKIFRTRVENYQHLITGLRTHDAEILSKYYGDEVKIAAEIEKLQKP